MEQSRSTPVSQPGPCPPAWAPYPPEDEIDLRELFATLWQNRIFIVALSGLITLLAVFYALSLPNSYRSETVLVPQGETRTAIPGGLSGLAGLAGVDLGGGEIGPGDQLDILQRDYSFMAKLVREHQLYDRFRGATSQENYRFGLGIKLFYILRNPGGPEPAVPFAELTAAEQDELVFNTVRTLRELLKINIDSKKGVITLGVEHPDSVLAHELVTLFLDAATEHLRAKDLTDIDRKIEYYNQEISRTPEVTLKNQLAQLISALIQKKVLAQAGDHYQLRQITQPEVAYFKDRAGPKRSLMVMVAMVAGGMLAIFAVFVREFIRKSQAPGKQAEKRGER